MLGSDEAINIVLLMELFFWQMTNDELMTNGEARMAGCWCLGIPSSFDTRLPRRCAAKASVSSFSEFRHCLLPGLPAVSS